MISKYILGDEKADAYAAGCAFTTDFIAEAARTSPSASPPAWAKAVDFINDQLRGGAQVSRQEHADARRPRR